MFCQGSHASLRLLKRPGFFPSNFRALEGTEKSLWSLKNLENAVDVLENTGILMHWDAIQL